MHDWTLEKIIIDWAKQEIELILKSHAGPKSILAKNFSSFKTSGTKPWGKSSSINEVKGPVSLSEYSKLLILEIQSGDIVEIEAETIDIINESNVRT